MVKYIKTRSDPELIRLLLINYLQMNKYAAINLFSDKEREKIKTLFDADISKLIYEFIISIRVAPVEKDLLQIYIMDKSINNHRLNNIISALDFGNRELRSTRAITRLLNKSIHQTKNYLEGI
mgnify:CR=1 FL=1